MILEPLDGIGELSELETLFLHTCTIQQGTSAPDIYGQVQVTWDTPTSTVGSICRLMPKVRRELATGAVIYDYVLFTLVSVVPSTLLVLGAEATHRITHVRYRYKDTRHNAGDLLDAGAFDIREISNATQADHHIRLALKRVG